MILYESHSILHGRPFPLKGRYMANLFVHFEAVGELGTDLSSYTSDLPPYLIPGSPEEANWRRENPKGFNPTGKVRDQGKTGLRRPIHDMAQKGDYRSLARLVDEEASLIHLQDENGWTPLNEAVRGGYVQLVKYLHDKGADVNHRTDRGRGGSILHYALQFHKDTHPLVKFLQGAGAIDVKSEL